MIFDEIQRLRVCKKFPVIKFLVSPSQISYPFEVILLSLQLLNVNDYFELCNTLPNVMKWSQDSALVWIPGHFHATANDIFTSFDWIILFCAENAALRHVEAYVNDSKLHPCYLCFVTEW